MRLLSELPRAALRIDAVCSSAAICALGRGQKWQRCLELALGMGKVSQITGNTLAPKGTWHRVCCFSCYGCGSCCLFPGCFGFALFFLLWLKLLLFLFFLGMARFGLGFLFLEGGGQVLVGLLFVVFCFAGMAMFCWVSGFALKGWAVFTRLGMAIYFVRLGVFFGGLRNQQ